MNTIKVIILIVYIIDYGIVWSSKVCEYMYPNGIYNGIQMHKLFVDTNALTEDLNGTYWMYSKGMMWRFEINGTEDKPQVHMIEESVRESPNEPVNQFSGLIVHGWMAHKDGYWCGISYQDIQNKLVNISCHVPEEKHKSWKTNTTTQYKPSTVIFSSTYVATNNTVIDDPSYQILLDTTDRYKTKVFKLEFKGTVIEKIGIEDQSQCPQIGINVEKCRLPVFFGNISDSLLKQLEGIVDCQVDEKPGHLLWFKISGQPHYCFTLEGQDLSDQCQKVENQTQPMNQTICSDFKARHSPDFPTFLLIVVIVLAVIGVILLWLDVLMIRKRYMAYDSSEPFAVNARYSTQEKTIASKELHPMGSSVIVE